MSGRRLGVAALGVVVLAVVAYFLFFRGEGGIPGIKKPKPPANAAFKAAAVVAPDPQDRAEAAQKAQAESAKITTLLNNFYTLALLRPARWAEKPGENKDQKPAAEALTDFFTDDAKGSVAGNIAALALTDLGARLDRVDPTKQDATKISFDVEPDLSLPFAIATVSFEATGKAKKKPDDPVKIVHTATYWLALQGDNTYKILAYNAELKADTQTKAASFGLIPEAAR
jgi:hypothetical protein